MAKKSGKKTARSVGKGRAKEVEKKAAKKDKRMLFDPRGFFTIYIDKTRQEIVVEHYRNVKKEGHKGPATGHLNVIVAGRSAEALCHTIIREELVSLPEHAAYLGRELQKAEDALARGEKYVQE